MKYYIVVNTNCQADFVKKTCLVFISAYITSYYEMRKFSALQKYLFYTASIWGNSIFKGLIISQV